MTAEEKQKILAIAKRLFSCRKCRNIYQKLEEEGVPFHPEIPFYYDDGVYQRMVIGINPGWIAADYDKKWRALYEITDCDNYISEIMRLDKEGNIPIGPYQHKITALFNTVDEIVNTGTKIDKIPVKDIYHHVFWANLSFCNSQKLNKREIGGVSLEPNITDEIATCLEQKYLKELITIIQPRITIIFSHKIVDVMPPQEIVKSIFSDVVDFSESNYRSLVFAPYDRKDGVKVKTQIGLYKNDNRLIFFLPHPEFGIKSDRLKNALTLLLNTDKNRA